MSFTTITNAELAGKGVKSLPDTPDMAASELKQQFDSLGDLCVSHIRTLINELEETTAAVSLGANPPDGITAAGNVQSILDGLAAIVAQLEELSHTHANKTVLDTLTEEDKAKYDTTALKLDSITSVEAIVHNSNAEIPTSKAVIDYVNSRLGG
jgi:hypothetical protein